MSKYLPVSNPTDTFWLSETDSFAKFRSSAELPKEADIVIIGSGYAGSTVSHFLINEHGIKPSSVLVLEARDVCSGATARNGGHLKPDLYYAYKKYVAEYGEKNAADIINFEYKHLTAVKELVEKEKIECDFVLTRACDVHLTPKAVLDAKSNYEAMKSNPYVTCKHDVQIKYGEEAEIISKVEGSPVCLTYTAGQLWPYKLFTTILQNLVKKGLQLHTNTPATGITNLKDGRYLINTPRGAIIAKKVVLATNAYTASVEPKFENKIVPIKGACSHIIDTSNPKRSPHLTNTYGIRYDGADNDYLINRPDGSVIVGGAKRHIFPFKSLFYNVVDDSTLIPNTKGYFQDYMKKHFYTWKAVKEKADYVWSGILGYTDDSLPYVGEMPEEKNKFVIAGFNGHGMPRVLLCAKAIAGLISGNSTTLDIPEPFKVGVKRMTETENKILLRLGTPAKEVAKL